MQLSSLKILPPHWPLTLVNGNKQPWGKKWQRNPYTLSEAIAVFKQGYVRLGGEKGSYQVKPLGIGILCGHNSKEFLFAIDCDGISAHRYLQQLGQLPPTVSFTSGRQGRCQYLYKLPSDKQIKSCKVTTAPGEVLEIRGSHHQSVLPPSPHPITGQYRWVNSPADFEVAIAPQWLFDWITEQTYKPSKPKNNRKPFHQNVSKLDTPSTTEEAAVALLDLIPSYYADDYDSWIKVGMALKSISPALLDAWDRWSRQSEKWKPGECAYKWGTFHGVGISERTLYWLAQNS
ncbi:MAG: bifunctional DNA primase/polymerase [Crocinitomicaceae bacterium]|nr:bifunctional DNA primase/polymerase [Crocinitomicaceae bacterium]